MVGLGRILDLTLPTAAPSYTILGEVDNGSVTSTTASLAIPSDCDLLVAVACVYNGGISTSTPKADAGGTPVAMTQIVRNTNTDVDTGIFSISPAAYLGNSITFSLTATGSVGKLLQIYSLTNLASTTVKHTDGINTSGTSPKTSSGMVVEAGDLVFMAGGILTGLTNISTAVIGDGAPRQSPNNVIYYDNAGTQLELQAADWIIGETGTGSPAQTVFSFSTASGGTEWSASIASWA